MDMKSIWMSLGCKFKVIVRLAIIINVSTRLLCTLFSVHFVQHSAFTLFKPIIILRIHWYKLRVHWFRAYIDKMVNISKMAASDGLNSLQINDYPQSQPLKTADLHHEVGFIEKGRRSEKFMTWNHFTIQSILYKFSNQFVWTEFLSI